MFYLFVLMFLLSSRLSPIARCTSSPIFTLLSVLQSDSHSNFRLYLYFLNKCIGTVWDRRSVSQLQEAHAQTADRHGLCWGATDIPPLQ